MKTKKRKKLIKNISLSVCYCGLFLFLYSILGLDKTSALHLLGNFGGIMIAVSFAMR